MTPGGEPNSSGYIMTAMSKSNKKEQEEKAKDADKNDIQKKRK